MREILRRGLQVVGIVRGDWSVACVCGAAAVCRDVKRCRTQVVSCYVLNINRWTLDRRSLDAVMVTV